jgi:hypothetical protein
LRRMSQARSLETPHAALCPLLPAIFFRIKPHFQHFSIHVTSCAWAWRLREGGVDRASPAGSPVPNRVEIPRPLFTLTTAAAGVAAPRETVRLIVAVGLIMVDGGGCVQKERVRCGEATSFFVSESVSRHHYLTTITQRPVLRGRSRASMEVRSRFSRAHNYNKAKKARPAVASVFRKGGQGPLPRQPDHQPLRTPSRLQNAHTTPSESKKQ